MHRLSSLPYRDHPRAVRELAALAPHLPAAVQNRFDLLLSGSPAPEQGLHYFARLREICDRHDVLLVSDEVICAFGRVGTMFASERFDFIPDIITCAKGMTSGYSPIGAAIFSDRIVEPFLHVCRIPIER